MKARIFIVASIAIVAAAIIAALVLVGSPSEERLLRLDERRVQDLQFIESQIYSYAGRNQALPDTLMDLEKGSLEVRLPQDPETHAHYEYIKKDAEHYELCALFSHSSSESVAPRTVPLYPAGYGSYEHGAGKVCFERNVDLKSLAIPPKPY